MILINKSNASDNKVKIEIMSENNKEGEVLRTELSADDVKEALSLIKESNKQARKRNRWAKRQHQQSVLNYEQAERQYLIEKSRMQPTFRLSVTEFLQCEPDFMNDPEQASEAKYLSGFGVCIDERVLRVKIHVKGEAEYMRPSLVFHQVGDLIDERGYSMSELIYFVEVERLDMLEGSNSTLLYLVYRDKTTLPVIHKYRLTQQQDSALRRWDAVHLDTIYVTSHKNSFALTTSKTCASFFSDREDVQ